VTCSLEELRDRALILFLLSTDCRISEALRLDVEDWNPRHMRVIGKGDRERTVTVTDRARQAVEEYLAARDDPSPRPLHQLHPKDRGKRENRLTADGPATCAVSSPAGWGIPAFRPHQLRHTLGTLLQVSGVAAAASFSRSGERTLPTARRSTTAPGCRRWDRASRGFVAAVSR